MLFMIPKEIELAAISCGGHRLRRPSVFSHLIISPAANGKYINSCVIMSP
jgi:hypothetical protein